ncbi:3-oxoacyl-[acyl-carrier-protein] synthase 3 [Thalassotalea insulae]|uniref:Beta-ketoacyl-[acyl-carrier-protein] synthase III n=1 Tax=Thalassotalea insulae TaxID=2056778 RepID=A0ABQ6GS06_9GAMM|nr:ketoacyl-ACP synthase III [Thalassotalea insulae]GLX76941.1 3-oxoacyl-[acyl-carrier-protein] synthase 3 [Thalassotalea insulae]
MFAAITGWGKCLPPAILSNDDLATFLETNDEWISTRTGMKERRISHVNVSELAYVACERALAAAGKTAQDVDLIVFGSTTFDELCPNAASNVQRLLGADNAACMDVNTACTSGMYSLTTATAMIKSGVVKSALVIGAEVISPIMDWQNRDVAVLFGDGAAALYLEASSEPAGVLAESLGCFGESREILAVQGWGMKYANQQRVLGQASWAFLGQEIFKKAVAGMAQGSLKTLDKLNFSAQDIDLIVPHQANLRIIDSLAKKLNLPKEKVFINIEKYGNMSAATALVAFVEAIEQGRVSAHNHILLPAFGGGLTWSAHLVKFGDRTQAIAQANVELPECNKTGLMLVNDIIACKKRA